MKDLLEYIYGNQLEEYRETECNLPFYLADGRKLYDVTVLGEQFKLVCFLEEARFNIATLQKQDRKYHELLGKNIVYGFSKVSVFQRNKLIENRIPFIAENGQVYLPFLGAYFSKCQKEITEEKVEKLSPSAQLLALYMFYDKTDSSYSKSRIAGKLGLSPMSVTRAVRELSEIGFLQEQRSGNETLVFRDVKKGDLSNIKPYLINPVQSTVYVLKSDIDPSKDNMLKAGEWSLADRSMLGYPKYEEYALGKSNPIIKKMKEIDSNLYSNEQLVKIQKWKYDPQVLGNGREVDPVSLICSFQGEEDERINMSLENLNREIDQWQIM